MGSRSKRQFVPEEFTVPSELITANFTLRILSVDDVEKDFEAVTSSAERLRKVWPDSGWPDGLTLRQNLVDLGWHEKEFQNRTSFAYTMVAPDESQVLGCVYFYPTDKALRGRTALPPRGRAWSQYPLADVIKSFWVIDALIPLDRVCGCQISGR
jgi:hypothetical protein